MLCFPVFFTGRKFSASLKTYVMFTHQNHHQQNPNQNKTSPPFMNTLSSCITKVVKDGYTENFSVSEDGMSSSTNEKIYHPNEVKIINFYRFEGQSDPSDSAILYVIETADGSKGTLTDAYGAYSDHSVDAFIKEVEEIQKTIKTDKEYNKDASSGDASAGAA